MDKFQNLLEKINSNSFTLGVLGLGYVGLPLAVLFAKKGSRVLGFEKDVKKVKNVNEAVNYIGDIADDDLKKNGFRKKIIGDR